MPTLTAGMAQPYRRCMNCHVPERLLVVGLFFGGLVAGPGYGDPANSLPVVERIRQGFAELTANRWAAAEKCFRSAVESEPTNSAAYAGLGYSLAGLNRLQEAATAYEMALALDPAKTNIWYHLGDAHFLLGDYERALDAYQQSVTLDPKNDRAWNFLGNSLVGLKRYSEAETAYQQALAINPTNSSCYTDLGYCQTRLQHYTDAARTFETAIALNPRDANAHLWLGVCRYRRGAYQDAIASLQECVSLEPTNFDGYDWLGSSLYMLDRHEAAVTAFQRALQIRPADFDVHYRLGRSLAAWGRYDKAAEAFREAIRLDPNDFAANEWHGFSLMKSGRFGEATASLEKAYEIRKEDKSVQLELFVCYLLSSQYEKAYRLYPVIVALGGGALMLGYVVGLAILLRFSFRISPDPSPGLGFSFAWLVLFVEGQLAFIFCLALLSVLRISESFLFGIVLAGIPVVFAGARAFVRQPWGGPFAWPLRLGEAKVVWQSLLFLALALVLGSRCAEWIAQWMRRPMMVQETLPLIRYALAAKPLTAVLSVVLIGPIAEEIVFRGLLYAALEKRLRVAGAILVSSLIFASVHLQMLYFIPIFCLGIVLGWARWRTGSLGLPIFLHVLNNGVAMLLLKLVEGGA